MELIFKKLVENLIDDYLYFFDHIAFSDGNEFDGCYCSFYQAGKEDFKKFEGATDWKPIARDSAISQIRSKRLQGYLAYDGTDIVGWVNTNKKNEYLRLVEDPKYVSDDDDSIQGITCFVIDPKRRKQGIATKLLEYVIHVEKEKGVKYLEAYPAKDTSSCIFNFHGYLTTFERLGFKQYKELDEDIIVRLEL